MDSCKPFAFVFFVFFFFFSVYVPANLSQAIGLDALAGGSPDTACLQKLIPCKDYVKSTSPPSSCCDPLKDVISTSMQCLCKAFNDPDSLKSLGITQDDALGLAKSCGTNPDASVCKTGSSNSTSVAAATTNTTASSAPASSAKESGASAVYSPSRMISFAPIFVAVALFLVFYNR